MCSQHVLDAELRSFGATCATPPRVVPVSPAPLCRPPAAFAPEGELYVARVTPVVHYTMGGVEIDERARALSDATGQPIPGLYAAGEVSGG